MITFEDFKRLDLRIGRVLSAQRIEKTDKLIELTVDVGTEKRRIVAGMAQFYNPEYFVGRELVILVNLEPRKFMEIESDGMVLAVDVEGRPVLLSPEEEVAPGSKVK